MADSPVIADKLQDKDLASTPYVPSMREQELVSQVWDKFIHARQSRDQHFEYFDNRNLITYIEDSVKRFNTNQDEREDIEDWQARVFDPFTRNKVIAILGKVATAIPKPEFLAVGDEDFRRASILSDLYDYSERVDDGDELMFYALMEAAVKGTVVGYEGYEEKTRDIRDISEYKDGQDLTLKKGKMVTRKLRGHIVPLEDFYPASVGIRKIKDMPWCFWRTVMTLNEFQAAFNQYPKAKFVDGFQVVQGDGTQQDPEYRDYMSTNIPEGNVEILRYYNQDTDEYVILANGIWLNPYKSEAVMPIPFAHKSLPFWKAIYEPLGDFFYGKSIPDRLKSMQDVINVLHNMMLDQSFLSIFPPILTEGIDEFEDTFIRPGRIIGVSNAAGTKELQISPPGNFHSFILQYTKSVLEESSVDAVSQGVAGVGDRVTAREINQAAEGVAAILGLFAQFIKWGVRDKARLRAKNILQFYNKPMIERIIGNDETETFNKAFNTFKIEDTVLTDGSRGMRIIEMFQEREQLPDRAALATDASILERSTGKKVEKIAVDTSYIRDFEFDIKLQPNPQANESKALQKALMIEFSGLALNGFPELVDKENLFAELTTLFGFRPEKFMKQPEPEQPGLGVPGAEGGPAGQMGVAENLIAGATGGRPSERAIRDLT